MGGQLDKVLFPAPEPGYLGQEDFGMNTKLVYIPKLVSESKNSNSKLCFQLPKAITF